MGLGVALDPDRPTTRLVGEVGLPATAAGQAAYTAGANEAFGTGSVIHVSALPATPADGWNLSRVG